MFADAALAARIDRVEGRFVARMAEAAARRGGPTSPVVEQVGSGFAVYVGRGSPMNKVIGIGLCEDVAASSLDRVEAQWRERLEPVRVELSTLAAPEAVVMLSSRGYRLQGFESVLACPLSSDRVFDRPAPGVVVEPVADDGHHEWLDIALDSFSHMDGSGSVADAPLSREGLEEALGAFVQVDGLARYLAYVDGEPAGEAAMTMDDGAALLAGSGTRPAYRGRGVQKALVARRLEDARAAGCDLAFVCTAPGSRSQANVMRRGFTLIYMRAVLLKALEG